MPDAPKPLGRIVSGFDLYRMPEFQTVCKAIGFNYEAATIAFTLEVTEDTVIITQKYRAHAPDDVVDTTTLHNEKFRTKIPRRSGEPHEVVDADQDRRGGQGTPGS